jgi:hypothetical protein
MISFQYVEVIPPELCTDLERLPTSEKPLLNYSTTLKMEAIRSSETSGTTQRTTRRHIPEEDTLHVYIRSEVMKSTIFWDITPCNLLKVNRRFGRTSPPSSGSKNKPSKKAGGKQMIAIIGVLTY